MEMFYKDKVQQLYKKLYTLQPFKACGPENITLCILKQFAHEFAEPIATIFNTSLTSGTFPTILCINFPNSKSVTTDL